MKDENKTKKQLLEEIKELKKIVNHLENQVKSKRFSLDNPVTKMLHQTGLTLSQMSPDDNLYKYIAEQMQAQFPQAAVCLISVKNEFPLNEINLSAQIEYFLYNNEKIDKGLYLNISQKAHDLFLKSQFRTISPDKHFFPDLVDEIQALAQIDFPLDRSLYCGLAIDQKVDGVLFLFLKDELNEEQQKILKLFIKQSSFFLNRQQNAKSLKEHDYRFKTLVESINAIPYQIDLKSGRFIYIGKQAEQVLGYPIESWVDISVLENRIHKDDIDIVTQLARSSIIQGKNLDVEYRIIKQDSSIIWIRNIVTILEKENIRELVGFMMDITNRKIWESEIERRDKLLHTITDNLPNSFLSIINKDCRILYTAGKNNTKKKIKFENFIGKKVDDVMKDFGSDILLTIKDAYAGTFEGENHIFEVQLNERHTLFKTVPLKNDHGEIDKIMVLVEDITQRKKTELALEESENQLRTLINAMPDAICFKDGDGRWLQSNDYNLDLFQIEGVDYHGKKDSELARYSSFYHDALLMCEKSNEEAWAKGTKTRIEEVIPRPDGSTLVFDVIKVPTFHKDGSRKGLVVVARDITERIEAEKEAQRWAQVFTHAEWGIVIGTTEKGILDNMNPAYAKMHGYTIDDLKGKPVHTVFTKEASEKLMDHIKTAHDKGHHTFEADHVRKDGTIFPAINDVTVVKDKNNNILYRIINVQDITKRKIIEDMVKASLEEKEVLLKEIHHRVKNNLQIIISLLNLQSKQITDSLALEAFQISKARVYSMALVHEQLYKSANFSSIKMKSYTQTLIMELVQSYQVEQQVSVHSYIKNINLAIDNAIPCGLILNELLSNAFKHAFPGNKKGKINIMLDKSDGKTTLTVQDNGVGIPADVDIMNTTSLGLQMVRVLANQIGGNCHIDSSNGTNVRIEF